MAVLFEKLVESVIVGVRGVGEEAFYFGLEIPKERKNVIRINVECDF